MFIRNWFQPFAIVIATLLIVAPIIGILLSEYVKVHEINAAYQQNAENDRRAASTEIAKACFTADFTIFSKCISDRVASYYLEQTTNEDLQAQKDMAFWAAALFVFSGFQLVLSLIGIWFLAENLRLVHVSNENTINAVRVAERANEISETTTKQQNRAYISLKAARLRKAEKGTPPQAELEFVNHGHTPAKDVEAVIDIALESFRVEGHSDADIQKAQSKSSIGKEGLLTLTIIANGYLSLENIPPIEARTLAIFVSAYVRYKDIFGETHFTKCRFVNSDRWLASGDNWVPMSVCSQGNDAD